MAMEITASRLFAPFFGTTIIVWSNLIGVILLSLSIGYFAGGALSAKKHDSNTICAIALVASNMTAVLPFIARPIMLYLMPTASYQEGVFTNSLIATCLLLAPPSILLGCIVPYLARLLTLTADESGRVVGRLYAISTLGSLFGVFIPVLVTIPLLGTRATFLIFSAPLALVSVTGLARPVLLPVAALWIVLSYHTNGIMGYPANQGMRLVQESQTRYNFVQIKSHLGYRYMLIDNNWLNYSIYNPDSVFTGSYSDYFILAPLYSQDYMVKHFPNRILVLGIAGGSASRVLRHKYPHAEITGVEIDPDLISIAQKYMGLRKDTHKVVIADGRQFLRVGQDKYDLVIIDVYLAQYIPFHMMTHEFFELVKSRMTDCGIVVFNVAWNIDDHNDLARAAAATSSSVFPAVYSVDLGSGRNIMLYAAMKKIPGGTVSDHIIATEDSDILMLLSKVPNINNLVKLDNPIFTDDWAPVEAYTHRIMFKVLSNI